MNIRFQITVKLRIVIHSPMYKTHLVQLASDTINKCEVKVVLLEQIIHFLFIRMTNLFF